MSQVKLEDAKRLLDIVEGEISTMNVGGAKVSIRLSRNPVDDRVPHVNAAIDGATVQMLVKIQDAGLCVQPIDGVSVYGPRTIQQKKKDQTPAS